MSFSADKSPDRITPGKPLEPTGTQSGPTRDFSQYMQGTPSQAQGSQASTGPSPLSLAANPSPASPPTIATLAAQAKTTQDSLGQVKNLLQTPNLALKRSQTHLLKNKLTEAHEYIRQAGEKLGIDTAPINVPSGTSPIGRFLAYVNDGQDQLISVQQKLKEMSAHGKQLNAAEMLSVTVKMNLAQQEIEYSTTLLGKVIDSLKQIMNTQL